MAMAMAGAAWAASNVTASINGDCVLNTGTISVPAGKTASNFKLKSLSEGTKCKIGGKPDTKGWGIKSGANLVYGWSQFKGGSPQESGGPLANVTLSPGTYYVYVDGGSGAQVSVQYDLR